MSTPNAFYFTKAQYNTLRDHAVCVCRHKRKHHDDTMQCLADGCECRRYGRRIGWSRGRKTDATVAVSHDQDFFESEGTPGYEWYACMYFDDTSEVPESCGNDGVQVGTIEVPLQTVDVMWRRDLARALTYDNARIEPAEHPLSRGCFITMPLVLCDEHKRKVLLPC